MTPVDLSDPSARRVWLDALRAKLLDLVGIAEDAVKRPRARFFSRAEQRRRIAELERALLALLDEAAGSLRPMALVPAPLSAPRAADDEGPPSTMRPT